MSDDKRTFEAKTMKIKTVPLRGKGNDEKGSMNQKIIQSEGHRFSFSKDVILRLIDWLEKE